MKTLVCTAALLVFLIAIRQEAEAQCGGFQASCDGFSINSNGVFSASCKTDSGNSVSTSIDLDNYISNSDGNLVQGGGFSRSCSNIGVSDDGGSVSVTADCKQDDGNKVSTSYGLDNNLENDNGGLNWQNC